MNRSNDAQHFWDALRTAHSHRTRLALEHLLEVFRQVFPHRHVDTDTRSVLATLLSELEQSGVIRLPNKTNRRAYDHSERTPLPKHVVRCDRPHRTKQSSVIWRPELAFASEIGSSLRTELLDIQNWLRNGGTTATFVALRERSVEIFGDEKRLDSLLGSQLFAPGRLTLELLHCYLPSVPIYIVSAPENEVSRPLLVVENHTTFDTVCRWNKHHRQYAAVAFGAGAAFIAACKSLRTHLAAPGCNGQVAYFGDLDPKGLWIPKRASKENGIEIRPDETLYNLLLSKGRTSRVLKRESLSFEPTVLNWLPESLRIETLHHFKNGRRLPQELISLPDLQNV